MIRYSFIVTLIAIIIIQIPEIVRTVLRTLPRLIIEVLLLILELKSKKNTSIRKNRNYKTRTKEDTDDNSQDKC